MPKPNTRNPELMGSEKMNVKAHFYYGLFNIMNESGDSIRFGGKGSLLAYLASLDFFYDMLLGTVQGKTLIGKDDYKNGKKEIDQVRNEIEDSINKLYGGDTGEKIKFYKLLKKYQSLLLYNVRNTGLVSANRISFLMGTGEEGKVTSNDIPDFPKPKEIETDTIGKPLSDDEVRKLNELEIETSEFGLDDDTEDEE